jgi:HJR/Mrr/RecB family endonuclease
MLRLLDGGVRIIGFALMGLIALTITWPWQSAIALVGLVALLALGRKRLREAESQRVLALDLHSMSPLDYEKHCAELLRVAGWSIRHVGRSGDQGVDVVAEMRGTRVALQAKKWAYRCSNLGVQQVFAGRALYGAHIAVVVAPHGFSRSAQQNAQANGVFLLHHGDLSRLERLARVP